MRAFGAILAMLHCVAAVSGDDVNASDIFAREISKQIVGLSTHLFDALHQYHDTLYKDNKTQA